MSRSFARSFEQRLESHCSPGDIRLGLSRVDAVARGLDIIPSAPTLCVGGTNGKGSVCALVESIFQQAGFRTGCYTSPHLFHFNERIRLNGEVVSEDSLHAQMDIILAAMRDIDVALSYFEIATLIALSLFRAQPLDIIIAEVGLGGRLDAVNILDPAVSVITNIGMDHTEYLGADLDSISREKAGIMRAGRPVIIGQRRAPTALRTAAADIGAKYVALGEDFDFSINADRTWNFIDCRDDSHSIKNLPVGGLTGFHQTINAATALCAIRRLPRTIWPGAGAIRLGLHTAQLPGRLQILPPEPSKPIVVVDVAHNAAAATVLEKNLFEMGYYPKTACILGMLATKDPAAFIKPLLPRIEHWFTIDLPGGHRADALAAIINANGATATSAGGIAQACEKIGRGYNDNDRILVTGSFHTVHRVLGRA